jgi:hypothetical protein
MRTTTNREQTLDFSVKEAIIKQREQLDKWKKILKPKIYKELEKWATKHNSTAKFGIDIVRGQMLDNYILFIHIG